MGKEHNLSRREALRRGFFGAAGLLLTNRLGLGALAMSRPAASTKPVGTKPNIVIILADDLGWGSVGCYGAEPKLLRTPNIDRLAQEGRRFTDANTASSVCSPTRYGLLTGRYCWRTSLKYEVLNVGAPLHIEPARPTIASMLKKLGYRTAVVGKWHLGYQSEKTDYTKPLRPGPQDVGFDYQFAVPSNHGDSTGVYVEGDRVLGLRSSTLSPGKYKNFRGAKQLGLDAPQRVDEQVMPTLTEKAVAWLKQQEPGRPFLLYYAPVSVHNPVTPSAKTKGTSDAGVYGDWIHELDRSVGAVLAALDEKGLTKDTLVLFTSDNGGEFFGQEQAAAQAAGLKPMGPFKGDKHTVWEGGFRVPYIVRWPGRVPAGTVCDEMINLTDTFATVAALVGVAIAPAKNAAEDSFNVLPAWLGEKHSSPLRPHMIVHSADGVFAIRKGPWKWIEGKPAKPKPPQARQDEFHPQLYHLGNDIGETADVQESNPAVVAELTVILNRCREQGYSRE
jgi:arylsulfatase A-like enzyme